MRGADEGGGDAQRQQIVVVQVLLNVDTGHVVFYTDTVSQNREKREYDALEGTTHVGSKAMLEQQVGQWLHLERMALHYRLLGQTQRPSSLVLYLHGFPSCAKEAALFATHASKRDALILAVDRPGFGHSPTTPHCIHSFIKSDLPHFLASILPSLPSSSFQKFSILGVSGGGPYTCSALYNWSISPPKNLPPIHAVTLAAAMPSGMYYRNSFSSLPLKTKLQWSIFKYAPSSLLGKLSLYQRRIMVDISSMYLSGNPVDKKKALDQLKIYMSPTDFQTLTNPDSDVDYMKVFMEFSRDAFSQPEDAFSLAFSNTAKQYFADPGFRLEDIPPLRTAENPDGRTAKVHIFQGGADVQVPKELGFMLAKIPDSKLHFCENESHISLLVNKSRDIIDSLLD
ncbi:hypothetical protein HK098_007041 [Nowakowskiella sp. JEL0407]|nr:hypothetical protein HK098_007041 [Nowakowskiella sp. JEL0407]